MNKFVKFSIVAYMLLALTGCATLFGDNDRKVKVNSQPQGAKVYYNSTLVGSTPTTVELTSLTGVNIVLEKPGYESQTAVVATKFQPVGLWNILFWPFFIVDAGTGKITRIDDNARDLTISLVKKPTQKTAVQ